MELSEEIYRAIRFTLSKKKIFLTFALLSVGSFISLILFLISGSFFYPLLFLLAYLLPVGLFFTRVYFFEVRDVTFSFWELCVRSKKALYTMAMLSGMLLLAFASIETALGIYRIFFYIPILGTILGVIFSSLPVILTFISFCLVAASLMALFWLPAWIGLKQVKMSELIHQIPKIKKRESVLFLISIAPLVALFAFLYLSLYLRSSFYQGEGIEQFVRLLCMITPLNFFFSFALIFFFNLSAESYHLVREKK